MHTMNLRTISVTLFVCAVSVLSAQTTQPNRPREVDSSIAALNVKDFTKARDWALRAVALNDSIREAWEVLGFAAQGLDDLATMVRAGDRLTQIAPQERNGWYFQALGYYRQERPDKASLAMREFCRIDPKACGESNIGRVLSLMSQDSLGIRDSVFTNPVGPVSVTLPKSWHQVARDDGKTLNWFVTLEEIQSDSDMFTVGGTFRWVRALSKAFLIEEKNNNAGFLVGFWDQFLEAQMKGFTPYMRNVVDSSSITIDGWSGIVRTIDIQLRKDTYTQRRIEAILARKDEIFSYSFECGINNWLVYEPRFKAAISSLKLPR